MKNIMIYYKNKIIIKCKIIKGSFKKSNKKSPDHECDRGIVLT